MLSSKKWFLNRTEAGLKQRGVIGLAALTAVCSGAFLASAQTLGTYGTPGVLDMPTAEVLPDGELAFTSSAFGPAWRNTMVFQMFPKVYGTFRYSLLNDAFIQQTTGTPGDIYDRSFDIHFQLQEEDDRRPGIALGLRDFGGTGIYQSEYLVVTKTIADRFSLTGGFGWGRLATNGGFDSPLCWVSSRFCTRDITNDAQTGQVDFGNWFTGPMAVFGGMKYRYNDRLTLLAEYSSDGYPQESGTGSISIDVPFNFGAHYELKKGWSVAGYFMYGSEIGVQATYRFNPKDPKNGAGLERAAPAIAPLSKVERASWGNSTSVDGLSPLERSLDAKLKAEGLELESFELSGDRAIVGIENLRYGASAQAVGRTNRVLANTLPADIQVFEVILLRKGVAITTVTTHKSDLQELHRDIDGSWRSLARAEIDDAYPDEETRIPGFFPKFGYRLGPYTAFSFFDPDAPIRYEVGAQFNADYVASPGLTLATELQLPFFGTLDQSDRGSDSVLPHVRSDWARYAQESTLRVTNLTAEKIWRPGQDMFARVTGGYLEPMFGGVSSEWLYYPVNGQIAYGAELNYAVQRDFDMLFGFQNYDVVTGHASVYYDMGNEYLAQVDAGRYLAGDWGATFTLNREFNNGFRVGAFFTLTNVSFDDFGEGAFDKGISMEIPISWLTGQPSRRKAKQVIRPVLRDGGARLIVNNRLYEYVRDDRAQRISDRWGRYYR